MQALARTRTHAADFPFRLEARARFHHTDAMGVVHHAAYLHFLEDTRVEYLRALGRPYAQIRAEDGLDFAVIAVQLAYHAPLRFDDLFCVHAGLAHPRRSSFAIEYLVERAGQPIVSGFTRHAVLDGAGRPVRVPAWLAAHAGDGVR